MIDESEEIRIRYKRRADRNTSQDWNPLTPVNILYRQEKLRQTARYLRQIGDTKIADLKVLEVGCGTGINLADLISLGVSPENIVGADLLQSSIDIARNILPAVTEVVCGDVSKMQWQSQSFDIVMQHTVFTSLLDDEYKKELAANMWDWLKPGGSIFWYDFMYNNPKNQDVRGIKVPEVASLFPSAKIEKRKITLAPPISRKVCIRVHGMSVHCLSAPSR